MTLRLVEICHQIYSMLDLKEDQVIDEDLDSELIGEVQFCLGPLQDPTKELIISCGAIKFDEVVHVGTGISLWTDVDLMSKLTFFTRK